MTNILLCRLETSCGSFYDFSKMKCHAICSFLVGDIGWYHCTPSKE